MHNTTLYLVCLPQLPDGPLLVHQHLCAHSATAADATSSELRPRRATGRCRVSGTRLRHRVPRTQAHHAAADTPWG
jgi:hypothetical protein